MPILLLGIITWGTIYNYSRGYTSAIAVINYSTYDLGKLNQYIGVSNGEYHIKSLLLEVRNDKDKLVKRFKPPVELTVTYKKEYNSEELFIPRDKALEYNIAEDYKVAILLMEIEGKPILPYEVKPLGYDAEKALESMASLEILLLTLRPSETSLNEAVSHLLDAYWRLEEGDVEGSRTQCRKALETIEQELLPRLTVEAEVLEREVEEYPKKLKRLVKALKDLASPGGPHRGPAPRTTTEIILESTAAIIKGLDKALRQKLLTLKPKASEASPP